MIRPTDVLLLIKLVLRGCGLQMDLACCLLLHLTPTPWDVLFNNIVPLFTKGLT